MTRLALFLINQNTSVKKEYSYSPIFTPKMHTYTRYTHSALSSTNELIHDEFYQGSREPINSGVCCLYTMRMSDAHMQTEYYVPSCCFSLGIHHPDLLCIVELCASVGAHPLSIQTKPNPSFSWVYSVVSTCCITTKFFFFPL